MPARSRTAAPNTKPRQPKPERGAKSGVEPGSTTTPNKDVGKRPIEEEDIFGGAERTGKERVKSNKAKP